MGFFKNGDELYDQAVDNVNRKNFSDARSKFKKAIDKGCANEDCARFCIAMIDLESNMGSASAYNEVGRCAKALPSGGISFGVTTADRDLVVAQTEIAAEEIAATSINDSDWKTKGQALLDVSVKFAATFGDKNLPLQEMLKGVGISGTKESLVLQAMAYEVMGRGAVYADPKQGSEYLQMAYNFRRQIGDSGDEILSLIKQFATSGKCWLCGRQVSGQGVHFMAVRSTISDMFRSKEGSEPLRSSDESFGTIFMCMPCYSAISNRSDEIVRPYYERTQDQINLLMARVTALEATVATMRFSSR